MRKRWPGGVALATMGILLTSSSAAGEGELRLTKNAQMTREDTDPARTYTAPSLAVDPDNPLNVVAAYGEMRTRRCEMQRSADGGQSWTKLENIPAVQGYPFCFTANFATHQALVAFGRNGTLYVAMPGWDVQDRLGGSGNVSVLVGRSTDLGDTWETTVAHNVRGKQDNDVEAARLIPGLVVDRRTGKEDIVYVSWTRQMPNQVAPDAEPLRPMLSVSTDGGRSFAPPLDLTADVFKNPTIRNEGLKTTTTTTPTGAGTTTTTTPPAGSRAANPDQAANFGGRDASITVDNKGTLYAAWRAQTANISPPVFNALFLSTSTDRGKTFTVNQITPWTPTARVPSLSWAPDGGTDGTLHLVYEGTERANIANESDIIYQRSTDKGKTWAPAKVLNDDDPANLYGQFQPLLSIAPSGRLDVAWWDRRNDPGLNFANDVYYVGSHDNGESWGKNVRVTDQHIDRRVGVFGRNFDVNAPPGVASAKEYVLFGWDDTRNAAPGDLGAGTQDVFTAAVQYKAVGGSISREIQAALAAVVGLLVIGLVLFVTVQVSKRRLGPPPPRHEVATGRAPAGVS